jgi:hypothetical protein
MSAPTIFVVEFEHAHRAFRCILVEGAPEGEAPATVAHWIVTLAGRTVWSMDAREDDTRERVQREVEAWWDRMAPDAGRTARDRVGVSQE